MFSKIKLTVISIVLGALAFGGFSVALAASAPASPQLSSAAEVAQSPTVVAALSATAVTTGTTWAAGQITAIAADNFTFKGPLGGAHVVYVTDQTVYYNRDGAAGSFGDLQVGDRVLGAAAVVDGKATARLVIDLGLRTEYRGAGVATAVNSAEQSFHFINRQGRLWEFYVDANTTITDKSGAAKTFADIQPGTRLFVHAQKRADGKWWAVEIKLGKTVPPVANSNP
jgi:hypothetical protein